MANISGKVAWITGAGTGIGRAAALKLAQAGAIVALTGRRAEPLNTVALEISSSGGQASVHVGDLTSKTRPAAIAAEIVARYGRIDILVNNAGVNITDRTWGKLTPDGIDALIAGNLASTFFCAAAVLPAMRAQGGGQLIHIASMSGRYIGVMSGPVYTAAKHGVVAMSHNLNMEECVNGVRSTVICPGEVATPILKARPVPVSDTDLARMLQPDDVAEMILTVACQPARVCINEVQMAPTWNRGYVALRQQAHVKL